MVSNPAGWDCESCRRNRLETRRRCGWLTQIEGSPARVVWARGSVAAERCPRSLITAESSSWLEMFALWKRMGGDVWRLAAKDAEAMTALDEEWEKDRDDKQRRER